MKKNRFFAVAINNQYIDEFDHFDIYKESMQIRAY